MGVGMRQAVVALGIVAAVGWLVVELATVARPRWARRLLALRLLLPAAWVGLAFTYARHAALNGD